MATTSRLLTLLSLLQARRDWPGSVLATRLGISDRTVRRDIDRLRGMGYRIESTMGPEGGYRLEAGNDMPPLLFDDDQALAVAIALRAAPALGAGIGEAAVRALATMRQVLPSRLRHRLDAVEVTTVGRPGEAPIAAVPLDVLLTLAQAVRDRVTLRFDYLPRGEGDPQPRRVEPHHLVTSHGRWYLLGWDLDRDDWRLFAAERIHPCVPHGAPFVPRVVPGGDVDAFVSGRFKGSDANEWPCRGTVVLYAPAHRVRPFAGDGTVTVVDEGRCTLEAGSWSWGALAASFGRFEVEMEVVGPPELAEAFAMQAERFAGAGSSAEEPRRGS
ncbi:MULTISPECIES: YafY family protein [Microbacterium]|uniref:helix-turn-helix transcriptional regulator n=1 Tax=Microbacterium TaxID=33882 RepID=UPI002785F5D9|nr:MULTISPECIES: WYL domain-containing protein [Microbacterium]MDQ1075043.1 putative DNA-binding transcriptional regulator YafY [Microbacterium sp. SORGH_AS_0969]MDQ1115274.1 putative DNA-binding transcriptional regulator YafY [Microbacterium testaceum]